MNSALGKSVRLYLDQQCPSPEVTPAGTGLAAACSAKCPGKETSNEDGAAVVSLNSDRAVLAVADGMGGAQVGERAAAMALRSLLEAVAEAGADEAGLRAAILDGIERANEAVLSLGLGAATTLAVVEVAGETVRSYHVGDSVILLAGQRGKIKHQTVPHSPVGFAVESGHLDESEAMEHADRHIVSNVIGDKGMRIEVGPTLHMAPRDTLLLATDGLCDNLYVEEITARMRTGPIEQAAGSLMAEARTRMAEPQQGRPCKPDDLTVILFRRRPGRPPS
ncbi:MAG: PP2C family protein-serine/threonine phosphatase [Planctomycetota bacterium]